MQQQQSRPAVWRRHTAEQRYCCSGTCHTYQHSRVGLDQPLIRVLGHATADLRPPLLLQRPLPALKLSLSEASVGDLQRRGGRQADHGGRGCRQAVSK